MNPLLLSLIVLALVGAGLMLARLRRRRNRKADAAAPFATCIAACPVCNARRDCDPPASEIES